jgi:hypothetical protein
LGAGPSKTTIGFTSNFTFTPPVVKNDTEINVYRPLANCTGTPCNVNKKMQTSQELILCECLPVAASNSFFKKLADTGTVIGDSSSALGNAIAEGAASILVQPDKTLADYRVWFNSIMIIFAIFSLFAVLLLCTERMVITPKATRFFNSVSTRFMVTQQIQAAQKEKLESQTRDDGNGTSINSNESSESSVTSSLEKIFSDNKEITMALRSAKNSKPMTRLARFGVVYLTNHFMLAIGFSKSIHYSRKSMIGTVYTRMIYSLAITMLFSLGYDKNGYSSYKIFVLKCMAVPILISPILYIIKKLMKDDNQYELFERCIKKRKVAPQSLEKMHKRSSKDLSETGAEQIRFFPRTQATRTRFLSRDRPDCSGTSDQLNESTPKLSAVEATSKNPLYRLEEVKPAFKKTLCGATRIVIAYVLTILLIPVSVAVVVSVANSTSKNDSWPAGYWYLAQLAYDLTLGQLPAALMQFAFFEASMAKPENKLANFINKYLASWLMNSDVKAIQELNSSIHRH